MSIMSPSLMKLRMQLSGGKLNVPFGITSTVLRYQANNVQNGHISMPSMVYNRQFHACSIFISPAHNNRPVAIAAGGNGPASTTAEVFDYTITGSSWQPSKLIFASYFYCLYLFSHS